MDHLRKCTDDGCTCVGTTEVLGRIIHVYEVNVEYAQLAGWLGLPNSFAEYAIRAWDLRHEEEEYVPPTPLEEWMQEEEEYWWDFGREEYREAYYDSLEATWEDLYDENRWRD